MSTNLWPEFERGLREAIGPMQPCEDCGALCNEDEGTWIGDQFLCWDCAPDFTYDEEDDDGDGE